MLGGGGGRESLKTVHVRGLTPEAEPVLSSCETRAHGGHVTRQSTPAPWSSRGFKLEAQDWDHSPRRPPATFRATEL
eukprot:3083558-Prymnesium_polylepis.1